MHEKDERHGYGIYIWKDGREYIGGHYRGKQHGLAICQHSTGQIKFSLVEQDKLVTWFDNDTVQKIKDGEIDPMKYFQNKDIPFVNSFDQPIGFEKELENWQREFGFTINDKLNLRKKITFTIYDVWLNI